MTFVRKFRKAVILIACIALPFVAGAIGSYFTYPEIIGWYASLKKPFFNPPNWIFGPVWSLLYLMMGISLFFIRKHKRLVSVFFAQLILNSAWSIAFFGLHMPGKALVIIALLCLLLVECIYSFSKVSKPAAWLLVPYILWVSFASVLNYFVWILNK